MLRSELDLGTVNVQHDESSPNGGARAAGGRPGRFGCRARVLAVAAAVLLLLSACGIDTAKTGDSGGSGSGGRSGSGQGQQITVTAFAGQWGDLFRSSFVQPFERETGIKVNLVYGANAEWLTKLRAANGKNPPFDVIAFTPDAVRQAVPAKLLQPLDTAKLEHWKQMDPVLTEHAGVDGTPYGVPLTTGSTGLMYRTDKIKTPPKDWRDIFDKQYCGHVALPPLTYNPGLEFFSALVRSQGGTLSNPKDVDKGFQTLAKLKGCVSSYPANAGNVQTVMENGDAWIVPFWDGRAFAMEQAGSPIGFTYPTSGPVGALTSYYIASGSKNTNAAYEFLNYVSAAQYQKKFGEGTWYAAGNDTIKYSAAFEDRIKHGEAVYKKFTWVDYNAATPKLDEWQQRWNQIFS